MNLTASALEEALNLSSDGVIVYEAIRDEAGVIRDYTLIALNDAATAIFGMRREEVKGRAITLLWPGIAQDEIWPACANVVETREPFHTQSHRRTPAGDTRWFDVTLRPYKDGFANSYRDITSLNEALEASEHQKNFYEEMHRYGGARHVVLRPVFEGTEKTPVDFLIDYANFGKGVDDSFRQQLAVPFVLTGQKITDAFPSVQQSEAWPFYCGVAMTGISARTEVHYRWDGWDTTMEMAANRLSDGRLLVSYTDTTAARKSGIAANLEKLHLDALFDNVPLGVAVFETVCDAGGTPVDLRLSRRNEQALQLSRIAAGKYIAGTLLSALMPAELFEDNFQSMLNVAITGESMSNELYQPHLQKWIYTRVIRHGEGLLCTMQDVTGLREQAAANKAQAELLEGVLQASPNAIAVYNAIRNAGGKIIDFRPLLHNEKAIDPAATASDDYKNQPLFERRPASHDLLARLAHVVDSGQSSTSEQFDVQTGRWTLTTHTPLGDGFVSTVTDITTTKAQQLHIAEQAKMLEGIMQASPHAILVYEAIRDANGHAVDFRILRFNSGATAATAMTAEALGESTLFTCMPSVRSRLAQYAAVIESGKPETYEFYNEKLGLWRRITNTPLNDGFVMTLENITEQKLISQKIEESARLLNAVLDASPIAIVVYEAIRDGADAITDYRPIIANKQAISLSGFTASEFLNITFLQRNPAAKDQDMMSLSKVVSEKIPVRFEHHVPLSDLWVNSITTPFEDGFIATAQDVTERKKQTQIIEEQALLFKGVLQSLQNGFTVFGIIRNAAGELEDLEYLQVADSVERDMGMRRADITGKTIRAIYPGIERTTYWEAYTELVRTGEGQQFEIHFTMPGYDNYLLNWATPLGPDRIVSVYYIINDLKRAQLELEHTVQELRRSNEDLEQFAAVASHDLQEPLRKLQSFGNMLEQRYAPALGESGKDLVRRMQGAAGRMRDLVTGLLSFARLSGPEEEMTPVSLDRLLNSLASDLDHLLAVGKGVLRIGPDLPVVRGIEGQLRHLFQNLLTNAVKFRRPAVSPVITISIRDVREEDMRRLSPLVRKDDYVCIEVIDNGIGFEPAYAERIFGLFERLHGNAAYSGTGIGLSICRRVAERHQGAIVATGIPGEGATFTVFLPGK